MLWSKSAMPRRPYGARFDDDASTVAREWFSPRRRQHHEVARDPAEDPLLEMPTAHVVRPGPLPTLRLPVRGRHGRRVPIGAHSDVRFVHTSGERVGDPTTVPPWDCRGPPACARSSLLP